MILSGKVLWARSSIFHVMGRQRWISPQFVGRADELGLLGRALLRASGGAGQCVFVEGEAGIGKSRLLTELRAGFAGHTFEGRCYEEDAAFPFAPVTAGLRGLLADADQDMAAIIARRARDLARLLPGWVGPDLGQPTSPASDPAASQGALFESLAGLFFDLAVESPLLVLFENLHWSDESTLGLLRFLARRLARHRILLIGTYRPDIKSAGLAELLDQLCREHLVQEITLGPLAREEVDALLRDLFESVRPISAEFLDTVAAFSEGNPFYVEELVRAMVQAGDIYQVDGVWQRAPAHKLSVPPSVQDAVARRCEGLSPEAKRVLSLAAIVGRGFAFELLAQVTGSAEPVLVAALKELIAEQLIVETSADSFVFSHAIIREAVQTQLLARERRALHGQVAATLEGLHGADADANAPELAYHYFEAAAWQQALAYARRAGEQASRIDATREALTNFTRALDCTRRLGMAPPLDLLLARAELHERSGDFDAADADLTAALEETERSGHPRERWQALLKLGYLWTVRSYERSLAWFEAALDAVEELGDPLARAETLNRIGNVHLNRDNPAQALPYHQAALAAFEAAADLQGQAETLELLAVTYYNLPDVLAGAACEKRALALGRATGDRSVMFHASIHLLLPLRLDTEIGPPVNAELLIGLGEEARALAHAMGWPGGEAQALGLLGEFRGLLGQYDQALASAYASLRMAEQLEQPVGVSAAERLVARIILDLLAFDEAGDRLRRAMTLAEKAGARLFRDVAALALAQTLVARRATGDLAAAGELLAELLVNDAPPQGRSAREAWCVRAELELAQGQASAALSTLESLIATTRHLEAHGLPAVPRLALLLGEALLASGRLPEAEDALRAALAGAEAQGRRPLLWRGHATLGRLHLARKQRRAAQDEFAQARTQIGELAASVPEAVLREGFRQRALQTLPAAPAPTSRKVAKESHHGLTERERAIATLVAKGRSNRDIADELVISERTAERHVANILAKLGLTSRVQLAAWVVEHLRPE